MADIDSDGRVRTGELSSLLRTNLAGYVNMPSGGEGYRSCRQKPGRDNHARQVDREILLGLGHRMRSLAFCIGQK